MGKLKSFRLALVALTVTACCIVNAEGRRTINLIPKGELYGQAEAAYAEVRKTNRISTDARLNSIVQRVTKRLVAVAERDYGAWCDGFKWEVELFESPEANAWCMPGGKMGVYTGILPICENEAALAAVMGHEIAHALLEHGNERMSQQLGLAGGLAILDIVTTEEEETKEEREKRRLFLGLFGIGADLAVIKPYSRTHESEADRMGLKISAAAGYDPAEAPKLWERMDAASAGQRPPVFFSTHPSPTSRVEALRAQQPSVRPLYEAAPKKYGKGDSFR